MILLTYQPENGNSVTFKIVEGHDVLPGSGNLLDQMKHFLRSIGFFADSLTVSCELSNGDVVEHSSEDE